MMYSGYSIYQTDNYSYSILGVKMSEIEVVETDRAPSALGPYSQAIIVNGVVYTSGQLGVIPETGEFVGDSAAAQTEQALKNLESVLNEAGSSLKNVFKTLIFLSDINDFSAVNEIYSTYFTSPFPARSCVQAAALPKNAKVEIEVIAFV